MMYFEFQQPERRGATWNPNLDVCERPDEIVILVEMPGVERSDVQITWNDGLLIISGLKRQHPLQPGAANYLCVERTYGHFRREININIAVDHSRAKAELRDGLMHIHLPKKMSKPEPATIPIL
jgi:HSP20 family protein